MIPERVAARAAIGLILLAALGWRLHNIGFGLPSMYDPDEPIFMITALRLLTEGTLNPGWFGHPGSTTIYLVAAIDAAVAGSGIVTGRYADVGAFAHAAYADPAMLFVPARIAMALLGTLCVWLTFLLGKRLQGTATGLIGAGLLALNGLHIAWSQVIRTDIHAGAFMLACLLFSARSVQHRRLIDYLLAGAFAGFATATKWPAGTVFVAVIGAFILAMRTGEERPPAKFMLAAAIAGLAAIFAASPFIFLDWQTVLANVSGEVRSGHLGHTGSGSIDNLLYYLSDPIAGSMGYAGLLLALSGGVIAAARSPVARWTIIPATVAFLALICSQSVIWSRWVLPVMPMLCLFAAVAIVRLGTIAGRTFGTVRTEFAVAAIAAAVALPTLTGAFAQARERATDTRAQAASWAEAHIPAGSRVVFEHLELRVRDRPWHILFPVGQAGCIDGVAALKAGVSFDKVQKLRGSSPIVDLGNVSRTRIHSCRADYAVLAYHDLYLQEADRFPAQLRNYRILLAGGRTVALFRPLPGRAGGPVVRIVALPPR